MSDSIIALPSATVEPITGADYPVDGPVRVVVANTPEGLRTQVVDVRGAAPNAFPPRTVDERFVTDQKSLLAEVTRRPLIAGVSTVWANRVKGTVTVIYDELGADATTEFNHRHDRLNLKFVTDPDWTLLMDAVRADPCGQEEFSDLIESVGHLIRSHKTAELMEIVESIRASSSGSFESRINRANGSQTLAYSEEVSATAGRTSQIEVPQTITFSAPPFEDYPPVEVVCWLRLRISGGQLRLTLQAQPFQHVIRETWTSIVDDLSVNLGVPVLATNL
ncbi:hypothetical protein TPA4_49 [Tsukamurella phage TPA4]|uniref:hypothetical protein n=1 Tax=Tsukamurella phage TPA4 TaxID=1647476 RepID=UPI0007B6463F|nr:hypothetical protein BH784_gp49 [Tsukamurella phage TPA4]AKJ72214.1 hypothetical protein TPA4_49 [Tsukamurella phage TPA4]